MRGFSNFRGLNQEVDFEQLSNIGCGLEQIMALFRIEIAVPGLGICGATVCTFMNLASSSRG